MTRFIELAAVRDAIVACEACPRLRRYCAVRRAREAPRLSRRHLLGQAGAGLRRSARAPAARRARAGRARRQPHRPRLHRRRRRRFRRLPDGRAPSRRLRQHPDVAASGRRTRRSRDAFIAAAVRCAPPDNKPTPEEIARCLPHLDAELDALPRVRVVVALGKIAFDAYLQLLKRRGVAIRPRPAFGHGGVARAAERPDARRLLSPEPSEHEHGQADAADDGRGLRRRPGANCHNRGHPPLMATTAPGPRVDQLLHDILTSRVYDVARETPLDPAARLSRRLGNTVLLKREDQQPVFSFKLRGAYNKIAHLTDEERARGIITASAGNHSQGVAYSAQQARPARGHRHAADDAADQGRRGARHGRRGRARRRQLRRRAGALRHARRPKRA